MGRLETPYTPLYWRGYMIGIKNAYKHMCKTIIQDYQDIINTVKATKRQAIDETDAERILLVTGYNDCIDDIVEYCYANADLSIEKLIRRVRDYEYVKNPDMRGEILTADDLISKRIMSAIPAP